MDAREGSKPWIKTRDGSVYFGLDAIGGFETEDGRFVPNADIVDSSEPAYTDKRPE